MPRELHPSGHKPTVDPPLTRRAQVEEEVASPPPPPPGASSSSEEQRLWQMKLEQVVTHQGYDQVNCPTIINSNHQISSTQASEALDFRLDQGFPVPSISSRWPSTTDKRFLSTTNPWGNSHDSWV